MDALLGESGDFNVNVLSRMRRRFSGQVNLAITENSAAAARDIYDQTLALPQTETEQDLIVAGYSLNGLWSAGNEAFIICYKGTRTFLLKALTPKESERASALQRELGSATHESLSQFDLRSHSAKNFMMMPYYPSTLERVPGLSIGDGQRVVSQISGAIRFLHDSSFVHMDIKPANICLNEQGDAILIDLGSVVKRSTPSTPSFSESTVVYVPRDFQPRPRDNRNSNRYEAVDLCDWWMLAVTVAEKVYGKEIGGSPQTPTTTELKNMLKDEFSGFCCILEQ